MLKRKHVRPFLEEAIHQLPRRQWHVLSETRETPEWHVPNLSTNTSHQGTLSSGLLVVVLTSVVVFVLTVKIQGRYVHWSEHVRSCMHPACATLVCANASFGQHPSAPWAVCHTQTALHEVSLLGLARGRLAMWQVFRLNCNCSTWWDVSQTTNATSEYIRCFW